MKIITLGLVRLLSISRSAQIFDFSKSGDNQLVKQEDRINNKTNRFDKGDIKIVERNPLNSITVSNEGSIVVVDKEPKENKLLNKLDSMNYKLSELQKEVDLIKCLSLDLPIEKCLILNK